MKSSNHSVGISAVGSFCSLLCFFGCWLFATGELVADKQKEGPSFVRPPMPESTSLETTIGTTKEFTLRIGGRIEEPMRILIRKKPQIGTLGEPVRTGRNTVLFSYTAPAGTQPADDSFTYAVQSIDSPVSAPARVNLRLVESPAVLRVASQLDFPATDVGEAAVAVLEIQNAGGAPARLKPQVNAPWHIEENSEVSISGGTTHELHVSFRPQAAGIYDDGRLMLDDRTIVTLRGEASVPLEWPTKGIPFDADARKSGVVSLRLSNRSTNARTVEFEWPAFFKAPPRLELQAGTTAEVQIRLEAPPMFFQKGEVKVSSGYFTGRIPFFIQPAPAEVLLSPADAIDFGTVDRSTPLEATLQLSNQGGLPIRLRLDLPKHIVATPYAGSIALEPGATVAINIVWSPLESGPAHETVRVLAGDKEIGQLHLAASVRAAIPVEKILDLPASPALPPQDPLPRVAHIPPVTECVLVESTSQSVKISWKLTAPDTKDFLIERRIIQADDEGRVVELWEPWKQVEVLISGDDATAHFRKLAPGTFWTIRLRGVDAEGHVAMPPPGYFRIETRPLNLFQIPFWLWLPGLLALAAALALFVKRHVRLAGEDLNQRIAELEK